MSTKKLLGKSLQVQGKTLEEILPNIRDPKLRKAFETGIWPIEILKKHYGFRKGITIKPDPKYLRAQLY